MTDIGEASGADSGEPASSTEHVVLVDDAGTPIGIADKLSVHSATTPLHLAFSCHVYNAEGNVLVTRRAVTKLTWPGVWTNTFCGHPAPGESMADALARRAQRELGITITDIETVLPDFRYRATDASGIVEYEICPVFRARTVDAPSPSPDEVAEFEWVDLDSLRTAVAAAPYAFSPWLALQLEQPMGATAFQKALGAIHALSHPVGALYDTHHGLTNAVFMPYVLMFNRPAIEPRIERLAAYLGLQPSFDTFLDWTLKLRSDIGVPHTLKAFGVDDAKFDIMSQMAPKDPTAGGNPVPIDAATCRALYEKAYAGQL